MIQPVQTILKYTDYDLDNGQPYDIKTGKDVELDFGEILRKEMEKKQNV